MIVENRTRWSTEDLTFMLHTAREFVRDHGNFTWVNEKTVVGICTYSVQKNSQSFGSCRGDAEGNLIEIKILRPKRVEVGAVDALAGVLQGMPTPFLKRIAWLLHTAMTGATRIGYFEHRTPPPTWFTDYEAIGAMPTVGIMVKPGKLAPVFFARSAKIEQTRLDREHKQWLNVHASRQAAIDKLRVKAEHHARASCPSALTTLPGAQGSSLALCSDAQAH